MEKGEEKVVIILKDEGDYLKALTIIAKRRGIRVSITSREGGKVTVTLSKSL